MNINKISNNNLAFAGFVNIRGHNGYKPMIDTSNIIGYTTESAYDGSNRNLYVNRLLYKDDEGNTQVLFSHHTGPYNINVLKTQFINYVKNKCKEADTTEKTVDIEI